MSNHDHLDPLPEPTTRNMLGMVIGGAMLGVVILLLDVWVTKALLGFENPYIMLGMAFMSIFAITGALKDDGLPMTLAFLFGAFLGVLIMNAVRVHAFGETSMLSGVGL